MVNYCKTEMMNKYFFSTLFLFCVLDSISQVTQISVTKYVPEGYIIFDKIAGDLNKDGVDDCIIITKGTDKSHVITDEYKGELDRNRRGILILFKKDDGYKTVVLNNKCFSSENEDGGVYFAPELSIEINKGILLINYSHGRYGWWRYTFRSQNDDFELIGYDQISNNGPNVDRETSINFSTKMKQIKINTNSTSELEDPVFEESWKNIQITELIKLSEIKKIEELDFSDL